MTKDDSKLLTEYLKECWHDICLHPINVHFSSDKFYYCESCETHFLKSDLFLHTNKEFNNRDDLMSLCVKIVENNDLVGFDNYAREFGEYITLLWTHCPYECMYENKCQMIANWLKRKENSIERE